MVHSLHLRLVADGLSSDQTSKERLRLEFTKFFGHGIPRVGSTKVRYNVLAEALIMRQLRGRTGYAGVATSEHALE